jgi:hypothetical protein
VIGETGVYLIDLAKASTLAHKGLMKGIRHDVSQLSATSIWKNVDVSYLTLDDEVNLNTFKVTIGIHIFLLFLIYL